MRWSLTLGRLFGIRIEVHVTFILFVAWIAFSQGVFTRNPAHGLQSVALVLLVFLCVLLHELGHALTARRFGVRTRSIVLLPIGGVARLERMPERPGQELLIAIAGPLVNVAIAGLLIGLGALEGRPLGPPTLRGGLLDALLAVNIVMVLFNLLPAFPMDGGRVLRALLAFRLPYARATRIASTVGQVMALLFGIVGLFTGQFMLLLVALFVFLAAGDERAMVETRASLVGLPVHAAMLTDFHRLDARDPLRRAVDHLMAGSQQDFPVLHGPAPVGILTRHDLIAALQRGGIDATVGDAMTAGGAFADVDEPLEAVLARMRAVRASSLPVLSQGRLVGLLTLDNVGDLVLVRDALKRYAGGA